MYYIIIIGIMICGAYFLNEFSKKCKLKNQLEERLHALDINVCTNCEVEKELDAMSKCFKIPRVKLNKIYNKVVEEILDNLLQHVMDDYKFSDEDELIINKALEVYNPSSKEKYFNKINEMKSLECLNNEILI